MSPIAHHAESIGNQALIFRRKERLPDGAGWAMVPYITGDTMRHGLREAVAYVFLDACGALHEPALSESALRLLFAGGMLTGKGDAGVIKLDQYREMCELVPSLALFGGCANNRCIPGRLEVDEALLVCRETQHRVPKWIAEASGQLDSSRAHVEVVQRVRMDPTLSPEKRHLLTTGESITINNRLMLSEAAHDAADAKGKEDTKSSMMPRTYERLASGSLFSWSVTARLYSDLDVDTFNTTVAAFLANASVGGKRGTGHGHVKALRANEVLINQPAERLHPVDTKELAPKVGELFKRHVRERAARVIKLLREVDA